MLISLVHSLAEQMPNYGSESTLLACRSRAFQRGYIRSTPSGYRHLRVLCHLHDRAKLQVQALRLHHDHNVITGHPHHYGSCAALAASPSIGHAVSLHALRIIVLPLVDGIDGPQFSTSLLLLVGRFLCLLPQSLPSSWFRLAAEPQIL